MKCRIACALLAVGVFMPSVVQAGDRLAEALAPIPGDAVAFVCIPSIKGLDADYQQAIQNLGLQPFVQPPMDSLVGLLKARVPKLEGLDEDGSLAIVFMPAETVFELQFTQAMLIPTKEPKAMIEAMGGEAAEGGLWTVSLAGQPTYVALGKNRLIVARQAGIATAVKNATTSIAARLEPAEKKALEGLDLIVWADADRLLKLVKPMIDGLLVPILAMQQSAGGFDATSAAMNKKQIDMFVEGAASLTVGVSLDNAGVGLRFGITSKTGSDLARQTKMRNTSDSLLDGLPATDYLLAFGQTADPDQSRAALKDLDVLFSMGEEIEEIDSEKLKKARALIEEAVPMLTGLRGSIEALPPGPDGLFGVSVIADTTDGKKALELKSKFIELGKEMLADAAEKTEDEWIDQLNEAVIYEKEAEEIAGVKVHRLRFDLDKMEEIDEEDLEAMRKVIGREGALVRMACVSPRTVVVGFGGGKARMATLIEQAKKNEPSLAKDEGIKKVVKFLPKERASVTYLAVDRILASVNRIMEALEEELLPVQMPAINAPLAMVGSGGDGWMQLDLFLPTELLVASKDAAMVMMGQAAAPPAATPAPSSEEP